MEPIDALKYAVTALDLQGGIAPGETAAYLLRLALCRMERDHYEHELETLRADWNALIEQHQISESRLTDAHNEIARLEGELSRADAALDTAMDGRRRVDAQLCAADRRAAWKRAAKHQRRMEREIELAVERRDERIRMQDATIAELVAHRDRLMAEIAALRAAPEPVPFEPTPGATPPNVARRVTRTTGAYACSCGKTFKTKQALGSHRRSHKSEPEPEPAPVADDDPVEAAWADELEGLYRCPQCNSLAFAQAIGAEMCVKCAQARKAA